MAEKIVEKVLPKKVDPKAMDLEERKKYRDRLLAQTREKDNELVVGIFQNFETRGGTLCFGLKLYPGDDYEWFELKDGEKYTLKRGVWKHVSQNCFYREYKHLSGHQGQFGMRAAANTGQLRAESIQESRKVYRFGFSSLDFHDDYEDLRQSKLVEVSIGA